MLCFNVETITKRRANEVSWSVGSCQSYGKNTCTPNAGYFNNMNFTQLCCLKPGNYKVSCNDCMGDGWKGGYILINGKKYCDNFNGKRKEILISVGESKGITLNFS